MGIGQGPKWPRWFLRLSRAVAAVLGLGLLTGAADPWATIAEVAARESGQGRDRAAEVVAHVRAQTHGDATAGAWLMAHAIVESSLSPAVERCDVLGALGERGLWQMRRGAQCGDLASQARGAAARLAGCRDRATCWGGLRADRRRDLAEKMGAR